MESSGEEDTEGGQRTQKEWSSNLQRAQKDTEDVELAKSKAVVLPIAATPTKEKRKHSPAASAILQWKKQRRKY